VTRLLLPGLLALTLALAGWGWWQHRRASAATDRAEAAEALAEGYRIGAAMRAAQDAHLARRRADAAALDHDLQSLEGADAPLDDYLDAAAGRLWP